MKNCDIEMSKIKEFYNICKEDGALGGWTMLIFSMFLVVVSFVLPPLGIIDGSVLLAVAEINTFYVIIFKLPNLIQSVKDGKALKLKYGDAEVEVSSNKEENC